MYFCLIILIIMLQNDQKLKRWSKHNQIESQNGKNMKTYNPKNHYKHHSLTNNRKIQLGKTQDTKIIFNKTKVRDLQTISHKKQLLNRNIFSLSQEGSCLITDVKMKNDNLNNELNIEQQSAQSISPLNTHKQYKRQTLSSMNQKYTKQQNTLSKRKIYQIPINSTKMKKKCNRFMLTYLKMPNIEEKEDEPEPTFSNFNTFYEFQTYITKISSSNKKSDRKSNREPILLNTNKIEKKCSLVPALRPPKYKQKQMKSKQSDPESLRTINSHFLTKRLKKQLENSLVIESKKQEIISTIVTKYKNKNKNAKSLNQDSSNIVNDQCQTDLSSPCKDSRETDNHSLSISPFNKVQRSTIKNIPYFLTNNLEKGVYQQKISGYRQFIFIVNFAHRIFHSLTLIQLTGLSKMERNSIKKYYYYVGPGNNSMLIRSLMKRRIWWEETKKINEAHFVWTQLKETRIFQNQSTQDKEYFITKPEIQSLKQIPNSIIKIPKIEKHPLKKEVSFKRLFSTTEREMSSLRQINLQNQQKIPYNPKRFMFNAPFAGKEAEKLLTNKDYNLYQSMPNSSFNNDNFESRLRYFPKTFFRSINMQDCYVHNHLQFNHNLGNKKNLLNHLILYYKLTNKPLNKAFPSTYHIKQGQNDKNFQLFQSEYNKIQSSKSNGKNIWIVKPGQNSNRGCGIMVMNKIKQIINHIQNPKNRHRQKSGEQGTFIIQKYIQRPLLFRGRKFDIRHYMVITCLYGRLRAYWYGEGYIRTSSYQYNIQNLKDSIIHLTNDAIQKESPDYSCHEQGNKLSYNQLQKHFTKYFPEKHFDFQKIYVKMRQLAKDAVNATYISLDRNRRLHNFEVFGLDFMIDQGLEVSLIEVNTNPCLQLSSNLLSRVIPQMLEQSLRLSIDIIFPPLFHYTNNTRFMTPDCNLDKFQFELIFDEPRDGQALKELYNEHDEEYKAMMNSLKGSEKQQDNCYDNDGQEISVDKIN